jgi:hypothetical protein
MLGHSECFELLAGIYSRRHLVLFYDMDFDTSWDHHQDDQTTTKAKKCEMNEEECKIEPT